MIFANSAGIGLAQEEGGNVVHTIEAIVGYAALAIEVLAVAVIVIFTIGSTYAFVRRQTLRPDGVPAYDEYKVRLGRGLLLGLEILVAADIVRTVVLELNFENVAILGILVLIRTFLSWSLVVEIEHRWPWQLRRPPAEPAAARETEALGGDHGR
jgi:uncharacterized membrane protein